jgi:hypothetical protein
VSLPKAAITIVPKSRHVIYDKSRDVRVIRKARAVLAAEPGRFEARGDEGWLANKEQRM